jgi:hypothetical protein
MARDSLSNKLVHLLDELHEQLGNDEDSDLVVRVIFRTVDPLDDGAEFSPVLKFKRIVRAVQKGRAPIEAARLALTELQQRKNRLNAKHPRLTRRKLTPAQIETIEAAVRERLTRGKTTRGLAKRFADLASENTVRACIESIELRMQPALPLNRIRN